MSYQAKRRPKVVVVLACGLALLVPSAARAQAVAARPWAVILCQYSDDAVHPVTVAAAEAFFSEAGTFAPGGNTPGAVRTNGMFDFWRDMSFGAIDLTGTKVFGPFPLGMTLAEHLVWGGVQPTGRPEKHRACTDAAAARGVKLNGFDGVIAVWSNDGGQFWGGFGEVALTPGSMHPTLAGHEMGHGFGRPHSYSALNATMYGDPLDIMSAMTFGGAAAPTFAGALGESGPGLNAVSRAKLGWLRPARVADVPPVANRSVTLDSISALSSTSSSNPLLARVWLAPMVDYYSIELQTKQAWDFGIPNNVAVVRWVPYTFDGRTYFERALLIGQSFVSLANDRQFSLLSISSANDPMSAVVQISGVAPTTKATKPEPDLGGLA